MKTQVLAAVMTLLPGVAAAQVQVSVGLPPVQVSVNGPTGPAPGPGYTWEPPRMVLQNGSWVHQPGYWRQEAPLPPPPVGYEQAYPPEPVYVDVPPPPPVVELRSAVPWANAVWVAGYWGWQHRRYQWVRGYWSRPRPGFVWEPRRWERQGARWASYGGGWRRGGEWDGGNRDRGRDRDRDRGRGRGRGRDDDGGHGGYRYGHHNGRNR